MKGIRYLTLLLMLIGVGSIWAQDDAPFNPASPAEPGPPGGNVPMLTLAADPVDGGTVTGAGWYDAGAQVTLRAYNKTNFVFDHWANANGETVSTAAQFKYTKQEGDETLTAYFRFSPGSPAEPVEIAQLVYHQLTLVAEEGGSVSGGGKYLPNSRVYLSSSVNTGYKFLGWYDEEGTLASSSASFYYTTTAAPVTLTAHFAFQPGSPGEPSEPVFDTTPKHIVRATAGEGGTASPGTTTLKEGATVKLTASANTGYVFAGWYVDDELYSSSCSFTYTMGTADITFEARFRFSPSGPGEPSMPSVDKKYNFYLMNVVTKPGSVAKFPIYLTSVDELRDMIFQLTFPEELTPSLAVEDIEVSAKAVGYTVSTAAGDEPNVYVISLLGGSVPDGNTAILTFTINVPDNIQTAQNYQVKINQITMTDASGTQTTASTRNGRISVYKNGDANGDDVVSITDAVAVVNCILGNPSDNFIEEAANVNDDEGISIVDVVGVVNIILGDNNGSRALQTAGTPDPD